jgi:hypothetical protein
MELPALSMQFLSDRRPGHYRYGALALQIIYRGLKLQHILAAGYAIQRTVIGTSLLLAAKHAYAYNRTWKWRLPKVSGNPASLIFPLTRPTGSQQEENLWLSPFRVEGLPWSLLPQRSDGVSGS